MNDWSSLREQTFESSAEFLSLDFASGNIVTGMVGFGRGGTVLIILLVLFTCQVSFVELGITEQGIVSQSLLSLFKHKEILPRIQG